MQMSYYSTWMRHWVNCSNMNERRATEIHYNTGGSKKGNLAKAKIGIYVFLAKLGTPTFAGV
jgi:hypothetical protein